jgi:uncharacterized protein
MRIIEIPRDECQKLLSRVLIGRLACSLEDQPYIVPVCFAYEPECLYVFSTLGKKIKWMRKNPKVCVLADEIGSRSKWISVVVIGTYVELREPQYAAEKEHARERLAEHSEWWRTPIAERRETVSDVAIEPVFFRIDITSMSGLRGEPEAE